MRVSEDIRMRVLRFIAGGGSKSEAARRFEVGLSSVKRWTALGKSWKPKKPGRPAGRGDKLDRSALRKVLEQRPDLMLKELAAMFGVSITAVHHACESLKLVRKKNGDLRRGEAL
jgi:transposase